MSNLQIEQFTARTDNFGVLIHDPDADLTASIDAPEEKPILDALGSPRLDTDAYLHHAPPYGSCRGQSALKKRFGVEIIGPEDEKAKIPGIDRAVSHGERFQVRQFRGGGHLHAGPYRW